MKEAAYIYGLGTAVMVCVAAANVGFVLGWHISKSGGLFQFQMINLCVFTGALFASLELGRLAGARTGKEHEKSPPIAYAVLAWMLSWLLGVASFAAAQYGLH
jgi:hypothetical protein